VPAIAGTATHDPPTRPAHSSQTLAFPELLSSGILEGARDVEPDENHAQSSRRTP
jgi:hypothetical protein